MVDLYLNTLVYLLFLLLYMVKPYLSLLLKFESLSKAFWIIGKDSFSHHLTIKISQINTL